jgi:hypothetical protein
MFDSGVRSGADVMKALALGAKFVFVGRLWIWGLSIIGETGVRHVMKSLLAELDILMNVGGFGSIDEIDRGAVGKSSSPYCCFGIYWWKTRVDLYDRFAAKLELFDCRKSKTIRPTLAYTLLLSPFNTYRFTIASQVD